MNKSTPPEQWNASTRLDALGISFWPQVVQELFGLLPQGMAAAWPETLQELADQAQLPLTDVMHIWRGVFVEAADIEISTEDFHQITADDLEQRRAFILDVRDRAAFEGIHLEGSLLLHDVDFAALLPELKVAEKVICVCDHGVRSVSAAMWMRRHGIVNAVSLRGGLRPTS